MKNIEYPAEHPKVVPGWVCATIGVGFITILGLAICAAVMLG
jgi:hypothetical protein